MQITVFGASGRVGRLVVGQALERGYTVQAFVHSHNPFETRKGLKIIQGDINDEKAVKAAIRGSTAVISALGSWGTKNKNTLTVGMETIIPAMQELEVSRLITLTGSGALWSGDKPSFIDKSGHIFLKLIAPKILQDGEAHLHLLEESTLDWSCVRAPVMKDKPSEAYRLDRKLSSVLATIPRAAVAASLLDLATNEDFLRQAPVIHRTS